MTMTTPVGLQRGAIVLVHPDPTRGHEQRGVRPAVILSEAAVSRPLGLWTVVFGTKADHKKHKPFPTWTLVPASPASGLKLGTYFMAEQVRAVSVERIQATLGRMPAEDLRQVSARFAAVHGLASMTKLLGD